MHTLYVSPVQRLYQVLSFSTEVVPTLFTDKGCPSSDFSTMQSETLEPGESLLPTTK